ncbi:MAG TPA: condensation domain-containing protein, partial [Streptosporangiaceae bacterium]|nr:condensation domain-containing protein [Streptosporangiaceae bacterium]
RPALSQRYVAPRTPTEQALAQVWQEVLNLDRVGVNDNFYELGGDSILTLRVLSALEDRLLDLPLADLLAGKTLAELAADSLRPLDSRQPGSAPPQASGQPLSDVTEQAFPGPDYPATPLQLGMLAAGEEFYHDVSTYHVRLPLQAIDLLAVLYSVTRRHPTLRTWFDVGALPPMARVAPDIPPDVTMVGEPLPAEPHLRDNALAQFRAGESRASFDHGRAPLIRFFAHSCPGAGDFYLTLSFHHAILDGWSSVRLIDEITSRYSARLAGNPVSAIAPAPHLMPRYAAAVRAAEQSPRALTFWQESARRARKASHAAAPGGGAFATASGHLDAQTVRGLEQEAARLRCGVRILLLAILSKTILATSPDDAVTVGVITHGRPVAADSDHALGLFLNTIPITVDSGADGVAEFVAAIQREETRSREFGDYPYARIRKLLGGDPPYSFNYTSFGAAIEREDPAFDSAGFHERTDLPVLVSVAHGRDTSVMRVRVAISSAASPDQAEQLLAGYKATLAGAVRSPEPPGGSGTLAPAEPAAGREVLGLAGVVGDVSGLVPVHVLVEEQVDACPDAVAVRCGDEWVSYAGL